jgi:hypothetical protein
LSSDDQRDFRLLFQLGVHIDAGHGDDFPIQRGFPSPALLTIKPESLAHFEAPAVIPA